MVKLNNSTFVPVLCWCRLFVCLHHHDLIFPLYNYTSGFAPSLQRRKPLSRGLRITFVTESECVKFIFPGFFKTKFEHFCLNYLILKYGKNGSKSFFPDFQRKWNPDPDLFCHKPSPGQDGVEEKNQPNRSSRFTGDRPHTNIYIYKHPITLGY